MMHSRNIFLKLQKYYYIQTSILWCTIAATREKISLKWFVYKLGATCNIVRINEVIDHIESLRLSISRFTIYVSPVMLETTPGSNSNVQCSYLPNTGAHGRRKDEDIDGSGA